MADAKATFRLEGEDATAAKALRSIFLPPAGSVSRLKHV
jgi:hypothetical protein